MPERATATLWAAEAGHENEIDLKPEFKLLG